CSSSSVAADTHTIVDGYSDHRTPAPSPSRGSADLVTVAATTTTLSSSLNPATVGTNVTFTAAVTGIAPTGSVAFTDGNTALTGCSAVALTGPGIASSSRMPLAAGTHRIVASYSLHH